MNERLLPGRIRSGWGVSILFLCLMALSGCCSHEAIRVNLIPRPAEMEVLSGYFQPGNTTVDDFTTVVVDNSRMDALGREGYELTVDRSSVRLTAATQTGIFYGKRTLEQLMTDKGIPCVRVSDRPRFAYRGMHMDVSRHFFPKSQVLKMLDEMARYKRWLAHPDRQISAAHRRRGIPHAAGLVCMVGPERPSLSSRGNSGRLRRIFHQRGHP